MSASNSPSTMKPPAGRIASVTGPGFSQLSPLAIEITEILRAGTMDGTDTLFPQLKEKYDMTVACIKEVDE